MFARTFRSPVTRSIGLGTFVFGSDRACSPSWRVNGTSIRVLWVPTRVPTRVPRCSPPASPAGADCVASRRCRVGGSGTARRSLRRMTAFRGRRPTTRGCRRRRCDARGAWGSARVRRGFSPAYAHRGYVGQERGDTTREAGGWMSGVNLFDNALFVGASVEGNSSQCGVSRAGDAPRGQEVDLALPSGAGLRAHRGGWREGPPERTSPVCSVPV